MVKLRDAGYCNLKLLLLFLVVYGHWIEPHIWNSQWLKTQYRWIYMVHMPLFCFLSGLSLRDRRSCGAQLRHILQVYLLAQGAAVVLGGGRVTVLTPYWHLWYLLSLSCWLGAAWLWFRFGKGKGGGGILVLLILLGCGAGYGSRIGRTLSLSRTMVFFPYFWAGLLCRRDFLWKKLRLPGFLALGLAILLIKQWGAQIPTTFLYHAEPYGSVKNGFGLRLLCYGIGSLLCLFLLTMVPDRRFPWSRAGADTMPAYLIHAPIVYVLRQQPLPWWCCGGLTVIFLYLTYKVTQWRGAMYGLVPGERREKRWQVFRKSTKNTENRCTGSSYP